TGASATTPYLICIAVSTTGDPTGTYYRYSFQYTNFPDYPKLGVWPDGYYLAVNQFNASGTVFLGPMVAALDRTRMLNGMSATQQTMTLLAAYGSLLPATLDGRTAPPTGSPGYFMDLASNALHLWKFHVDWSNVLNTTFTGPTTLAVAAFSQACSGTTCIPQSGTTQQLDSLADRLMYRLAYRNFGDHESLVTTHSVTAGSSVGVRWYELRMQSDGSPSLFQSGTYAPDSNYRWMGSAAMDSAGDVGLGFSVSSSSTHPGIAYTGRLANDATGTMPQGESTVVSGGGSQTGGLSRWGDYSSMSVDPADGCTFWYTNEYLPSNGSFNWVTRIASFKFPSCGTAPPANDFSISANPSSLSLAPNTPATSTISTAITTGSAQTVSLTVSGVPSGASASLNPTSVTSGGSSTLNVSSGTAAAGTYTLTVTGTGSSATTHSTTVTLTLSGPPPAAGITNGDFESGNLSGWTSAGSASISTAAHGGTYSAMVGYTSPTNGDSSIAQTFTAPSAGGTLSFWYQVHCPDTLTYDWATATLVDNGSNTTTTMLPKTCSNAGTWAQATASLTGGHTYNLA